MEVGGAGVQETGDGRGRTVQGEEEVAGRFHRVRRGGGLIISQAAHGDPTRNMRPPDEGGQRERGGTYHIRGVLPQDTSVGEMIGTGMPL